jgi:hypothetical protein
MADDLDKFVLEYRVQLTDSIDRLKKLRDSMENVDKTHGKASKNIKEFGKHFRGLSGNLDTALDLVGKFGGKMAGIAAPILAAGAAIKFVTSQVKAYQTQLALSYSSGMSIPQMENLRRMLVAGSGGQLRRAQIDAQLPQIAAMVRQARIDPTGVGAFNLRRLGVDASSSPEEAFRQMGMHWAGMTQQQAEGEGQAMGISPQLVDGLRNLGTESAKAAQMTIQQQAAMVEWQQHMQDMNGAIGRVSASVKEFSVESADHVIDFFGSIFDGIESLLKKIEDSSAVKWLGKVATDNAMAESAQADAIVGPDVRKSADQADEKNRQHAKSLVDKQNENVNTEFDAAAAFQRAAALFQSSVNAFTNTMDSKDFGAILAGEAGGASGMTAGMGGGKGSASSQLATGPGVGFVSSGAGGMFGSSSNRGARNMNPGNLRFGDFAKAHGAIGADDKGFAIFPDAMTGYAAMGALLRGKQYAGGGLDTVSGIISKYAPSSENDTAGYIAAVAKDIGVDPNAHLNAAQLDALQARMARQETGFTVQPGMAGTGQYVPKGSSSIARTTGGLDQQRLLSVAGDIASGMNVAGVTGAGIMQGQYTKGDINIGYQRAMSQARVDFMNAYQAYQAGGLNAYQKRQAYANLRTAAIHEQNIEAYGAQVMSRAREGGQALTAGQTIAIGSPNIAVNLNGVKGFDDKAFKAKVESVLTGAISKAMNDLTDQSKV